MATPQSRDRGTHQALWLAVDVAKLDACFSDGRSVDERRDFHHVRQQKGVEPIQLLLRPTKSKLASKERTYSRQTASKRKERCISQGSCPWSGVGGGIVGSGRCLRNEQE